MLQRIRSSVGYKRLQKRFLYILVVICAIQGIRIFVAEVRNHYFVKTDKYAVVLNADNFITAYDYWISPVTYFFAAPSWTHYFNQRNQKIQWCFWAQSEDLYQAVQDPNCHSIVVIGHGTYHAWRALDTNVTNDELAPYVQGLDKKPGEWFQLTCARDDGYDCRLGELVMKPQNVYTYHRKVNSLVMIIDAFSGFRYIKSLDSPQNTVSAN